MSVGIMVSIITLFHIIVIYGLMLTTIMNECQATIKTLCSWGHMITYFLGKLYYGL